MYLRLLWGRWWRLWEELEKLPREARWLVVCAYCHRGRNPDGAWDELPPFLTHRQYAGLEITHGACPACETRVLAVESASGPGTRPGNM